MNSKIIFSILFFFTTPFILLSCGGDKEDTESLKLGNYYLESIEITGYELDFQSLKLGTYSVDVDSETSTAEVIIEYEDEVDIVIEQRSSGKIITFPLTENKFIIELSEGSNFVYLSLSGLQYDFNTVYTLELIKPRASAVLSSYNISDVDGATSQITLTPTFDYNVFDYSATVDYSTCAYSFLASTQYIESTMTVNGESIDSNIIQYQNLREGRNVNDLIVTSENGENTQRYTLTVDREEGSQEQIRSDSRLMGLQIQELDINFICGINSYFTLVDLETDSLSFAFETVAAGARVYWEGREISPNETFAVPIEDDQGALVFTIESVDQSSAESYTINYFRRFTNLVEVDNVEELSEALKNAQPNDEIRIAEGEYDISLLQTENPAFFSQRSGTANEPIYLVPESGEADVILRNADDNESVFRLEGNHWNISNIVFEGAQNGILLSHADNNEFRSVVVRNNLARGLWIQNASDQNRFVFSEIHDVGTEEIPGESAITLGEDILTLPEDYVPPADNQIRHNEIYLLATSSAIQVEEGVANSLIEYNAFIETRDKYAVDHDYVVKIQGSDTLIRYNAIQHELLQPLRSAIAFVETDLSTSNTPISNDAWVYQNNIDFSGSDIPIISADSSYKIYAADNQRLDSGTIRLEGNGIDTLSFSTPQYHIQLADDDRKCLGIEQIDDDSERYFMVVAACDDSDELVWSIEVDSGPYIILKNKTQDDSVLRTFSNFQNQCEDISTASSNVFLDDDVGGYIQRWAIDLDGENVVLRSKFAISYSLTVSGTDLNNGSALVTCPYSGESRQQFRLLPVVRE